MPAKSHGQSESPEYAVWLSMKARCKNAHDPRYGGRGIRVCQRWHDSFRAFMEDMGPRPSAKHTVERIDNAGNYEPGNCRWATRTEQARNTRSTVFIHFRNERRSLRDWAEQLGIPAPTIYSRLFTHGYSVHASLTTAVGAHKRRPWTPARWAARGKQ